MKIKIIYFLFLVLISVSCSEKVIVEDEVKTIQLKETKDVLPISSFIQKLDYLELSFPESKVEIGQIEDLKIAGDNIFIKQRKAKETSLLQFSKAGVFSNEIKQNVGGIHVFRDVIEYNNEFAIWGEKGIHVLTKTGVYKQKLFDNNLPGNRFFYSNKGFFLFHELAFPGFLVRYNEKGIKEKVLLSTKKQTPDLGYSTISFQGKENYHLFSPLNDTIYAFSAGKLIPKYRVDGSPFPSYQQLMKNVGDRNPLETLKYINNTQHVVVKNYLENKNYIFITYWVGSTSNNVIIKKKSWETTYFASGVNDIDGGIWESPVFLSDDDVLYIPINSYKIGSHKILNKRKKGFEKLKEKNQFDNNSIVMRCKLK